jgi:hypothetical protein
MDDDRQQAEQKLMEQQENENEHSSIVYQSKKSVWASLERQNKPSFPQQVRGLGRLFGSCG